MAKEQRLRVASLRREPTITSPPTAVLCESGVRYLCGYCGVMLAIATPEQIKEAGFYCTNCGRCGDLDLDNG